MLKKIIGFLFCSLFFVSLTGAQTEETTVFNAEDNREQTSVEVSLAKKMSLEAEALVNDGKLPEARDLYSNILNNDNISEDDKYEIRPRYEELNMKILFSKTPTNTSTVYKVVSGDSLYKIAKKFKTTVGLLKKANHLDRDTIYVGEELKVTTVPFSIFVDKSDNILQLKLADRVMKTYRVATGKNNCTPVGTHTIKDKLPNPTWYHAGAIVPPESEENILGTRWMGFDLKGYGIHGTRLPESIGTQDTAGCVRMYNHEVEELYSIVPVGTKVVIVD